MRTLLTSSLLLCSVAIAQEGGPQKVVTGNLGIDFTNQYFFRGIAQENQGFIAQPYVDLSYGLYGGQAEGLHGVNLTFGLWNSLHDGPTGSEGGTGMWYESDFFTGVSGTIGERWSAGITYTAYHSPNGRFGTVEEIAFSLGFDDKGLSQSVASGLQPSVIVAFETDGQADAGDHVGIYGQIGIEPSFALGQFGSLDVTLAVPVTLGLSLSDYYQDPTTGGDDDAFGFLDVGAVLSSALPFLPAGAGVWNGELGLHWLLLGNNNEERNVGDRSELIVSFGLSTTF